jgi:[acyl-carrier-protein] S-malonyltransferase
MAALIGADVDVAEKACTDVDAWLANDNAPGQVVIGGTAEGLRAARARAGDLGVRRVIALKVQAAFHTPLMQPAADALAAVLATTAFRAPSAPVVSNTDARPYAGADGWPQRLADHLISPVRWRSSMETLVGMGSTNFYEVGPGNVLAGLAKRTVGSTVILRSVTVPTDALLEVA